ncbi:MAG: protein kinase [Actinomycetota bacterium]|nr:protein kinase [Actinomycetota bacterium]
MARLSRYLLDDEQPLLATRPHVAALFRPLLLVAMAVALSSVTLSMGTDGAVSPDMATWGSVALVALAALRFGWAVFKWRRTEILLSSKRLLGVSGGLRPHAWSVRLRDIAYVHCTKSILGKLFGYADFVVRSTDNIYRLDRMAQARSLEKLLRESRRHADRAGIPEDSPPAPAGTRVYTPPGGAAPFTDHKPRPREGYGSPIGMTFGERYRIVDKIDAGGMGTVYEALDERLGRPVAIKLMREELVAEAQFVERFRREARSAAMLSHPNIAAIFDYGEDRDAQYIVMELLEGRDLSRVIAERQRVDMHLAVSVARQTLEALQHAHEKGVVHRDVKPANIVMVGEDRVKVTDFGIAQAVGATRLTATGALLGSAHYVAPERVRGDSSTAASDIYSVGIVLYEMLVGEPPFAGESMYEVLQGPLRGRVPVPSRAVPGLPTELDEVVSRATEPDPQHRYSSAHDMAQAIAAVGLSDEAVRSEVYLSEAWTREDTPPLQETLP